MDYISELPDPILSNIVASLSVKDMLKTSVLSKRWSNVWSLTNHLNFHVHSILGSEDQLLQLGYLTTEIDDDDDDEYDNDNAEGDGDDADNNDNNGDGDGDDADNNDNNNNGDNGDDADNNGDGDYDTDNNNNNGGDGDREGEEGAGEDKDNREEDTDEEDKYVKYYIKLSKCRAEFVKRVDQFVKNFQGTRIDAFLVNFYLDSEHSHNIDEWIRFALARRVQRIDLLFRSHPYEHDATRHQIYEFPFALFSDSNTNTSTSTLKSMCLERCFVRYSTSFDFSPFTNLRSLELEDVQVHETFITSMLSNCKLLQELTLSCCYFQSTTPNIVSSSLCHLKLSPCLLQSYHPVYLSSVDCIKLTSLEYGGGNLKNLSVNAPVLKSLKCSARYNEIAYAFALFATLPQLEILYLDLEIVFYIDDKAKCLNNEIEITQPLKHLKQLNVIIKGNFDEVQLDLLWIFTILQACPLLQKLSVMVAFPKFCIENQKDMKDFEMFSHNELKVIEMGGCVGNWYEIEFAMNVLKYAHNLEQIVMSPHWREYDSDEWKWHSNPVWFQNGRERVREQFQGLDIGRAELILI